MWALSGTPFEKSPEDLEGYLQVLRLRARAETEYELWEHFATADEWSMIKHARGEDFQVIIKAWNTLMKIGPREDLLLLKDFLDGFGGILKVFMIRRTTETLWFGKSMADIPENDHTDVPVESDPRFQADMKWLRGGLEWELRQRTGRRGVSSADWMKSSYMLRLASTFPAIASFHRKTLATKHLPEDSDTWRFTGDELKKNRWYDYAVDSPYKAHYKELADSSNKLKWLYEKHLEKRVGGDVRVPILPLGKDKFNDDERVIIPSSFPSVAYITYLVSTYNPILYTSQFA